MVELFPMIWQIKGKSLGRGGIDQERSREASESQMLVRALALLYTEV